MKTVWVIIKNASRIFYIKKKHIIFVDLVMLKKMFSIFCLFDILTSSKNVDLNITAQNGKTDTLSVSVGHVN